MHKKMFPSEIYKYSEITKTYSNVIDNFNVDTLSTCVVEKIEFYPVYRVSSQKVLYTGNLIKTVQHPEYPKFPEILRQDVHEKYFQCSSDAFKYWSQLMSEKESLF